MDNVYQSLKAFLKSFLNLFLAVVDFFTSLIDGLASVLVKLRPSVSLGNTEFKKISKEKRDNVEEILVEEIRNELKQKVTSKEKYYYLYACVTGNGTGFYAIVLSVLVFALAGMTMFYSTSSYGEARILAAVIMAVLCAVTCIAIAKHQKKIIRNKLVKQILDEEFSDKLWEKEGQAGEEVKPEKVTDTNIEAEKEEQERSKEIAKIQSISVVSKEEIG